MAFVPNWSPTAYYNQDDRVFYVGTEYILNVAGNTPGVFGVPPPSNPAAWSVATDTAVTSISAQGGSELAGDIIFTPGNNITISTTGGGTNGLTISSSGGTSGAFSYNIYVSNISGSDATGNGLITNPLQTISQALFVASSVPDSNQVTINVAPGLYPENLSITRANTFITGSSPNLSTSTIINGIVTIDNTASDLPFVIGGLSSVQIMGIFYANTLPKTQSFLVTDCLIAPDLNENAIEAEDTSPTGGSGDITFQNCLIYMSDQIAVLNNNAFMSFINCEIKNNPNLTFSPLSLVITAGRGRVNFFGCVLTQGSTLNTVSPIINLQNNVGTASMVVSYTTIQYSSAASDFGSGNKCCIRFANSGNISPFTLFNCLLLCQGATTTNGTPAQFVCVQKSNVGSVLLTHGQNSGAPNAHFLPPSGATFTKIQFLNVT